MWQLIKLTATNICAFEQLEYLPLQNQATLVFGNNLDSDSQNSNGSGKSALIEALAIGLLGEPLRKVNADEIINDRFDEATVVISLYNQATDTTLDVCRTLSRKTAQDIHTFETVKGERQEIKQATVLDYNKYVLGQLGLTKDDILHNFILTARKYQSFLSSSDKDKKEIINRFSNGVMVDESIEALHADMEPLQVSLREAETEVARCAGRVSALAEEIERLVNEEASNKVTVQERIVSIQNAIVTAREQIRDTKRVQENVNVYLDKLDELDIDMQALEKAADIDTAQAYNTIAERFQTLHIPAISNYVAKIEAGHNACEETSKNVENLNRQSKDLAKQVCTLESRLQTIEASNKTELATINAHSNELKSEIEALRNKVCQLKDQTTALTQRRSAINQAIATLEKQLAGVIQCPKCHYEFVLSKDMDVAKAREELNANKTTLEDMEMSLQEIDNQYNQAVRDGKAKSEERMGLDTRKQELLQSYNEAKSELTKVETQCSIIRNQLDAAQSKLRTIQDSIANMRKMMFDEVFDAIDAQTKRSDQQLEGCDKSIQMTQASIETYEERIKQLQSASQSNELERIKERKTQYELELKQAEVNKETVAGELNVLKAQEATFVEFKTYLANTKINAISQITNDFLEAIGSDIRVNFSGYTMLKSGKVRDKISVSLIRDGIDCGSFDKFSAGEKCRVELASVLALHKLSNVNCEDGKGLNLLVIDEILDCTDETGLANVFKALNDTQITALVVSHGNIAENYPNRLVVTKQNGISKINETFQQ